MKKLLFLIVIVFITNSLVFANGDNEETLQDSIKDSQKVPFKIPMQQDHLKKDVFGNPVLEREIKDFETMDREEQKDEAESYLSCWVFVVLFSPLFLPQKLLDDDYSDTFYFQKYPFEKGDGFTEFDGKKWIGNLNFSTQYVNKDIWGYHLNSSFGFLRLSIEAAYSNYKKKHNHQKESLSALDATLEFIFAQNRYINFRSGLGYQHFDGETKEDGLKWIYKIHVFQRPFNLNLDYGLIFYKLNSNNSDNIINEFNMNFGLHSKRVEFKIGYRFFKIIREKLNGPEVSIVVWF